jgi:EpsI family protein
VKELLLSIREMHPVNWLRLAVYGGLIAAVYWNSPNLYQLKIYAFWDALIRQRTDGALVRLITPVYEQEKLEDAEARLQGFTREIVPVLDGFIPK